MTGNIVIVNTITKACEYFYSIMPKVVIFFLLLATAAAVLFAPIEGIGTVFAFTVTVTYF